jgi:DNA-binding response OmpR family regulator
MPQTILVAEDDPKTTASIQLYLRDAGYEVRTAGTGSEALALARKISPDLVVLDIMLPQLSGLDVCRLLRAESQVPIIMLTARTLEEDRILGFDLGADDYVSKPFSPRELVRRVQAILRRAGSNDDSGRPPRQYGNLILDEARHEVTIGGNAVGLTATQFKLLEIISRRPGRVYSREELVRRLFGDGYESLTRSIDSHVMNLRKKIEPDPGHPIYVLTVYGVGYKFSDHVS